MQSASRLKQNTGFTLVEVVAAVCVMALAITTSITTLQYAMRAIDNARYTTLAGQILQSQMEKLRLLTWAQLTNTTSGPVTTDTSNANYISDTSSKFTSDLASSTGSSAQLSRFTCTQSIVAAPSPFNLTMKDVTLTATWQGADGRSHSLSYKTRYGQNGISDFFYTTH